MTGIEIRDIRMVADKKGSTITFDIIKAAQLKAMLDPYRRFILDIGLAIYDELKYACVHLGVELPNFDGDAFMETRKHWSSGLKKYSSLKSNTKKLRRDVFVSIHIRNKYAHGKLSFYNNEPLFTYNNENGEEVTEPFSEQVMSKDREQMQKTLDDLRRVNHKLSKKEF